MPRIKTPSAILFKLFIQIGYCF